jgi:hypothetical protein
VTVRAARSLIGDLDQMLYATDHAADLRRVCVLDLVPDAAQAK